METDAKTVNDQAIELTDDSEWTLNDLIEYSREKISSGDYQGALEKLIPASEGSEYSDFVPIEGLKGIAIVACTKLQQQESAMKIFWL